MTVRRCIETGLVGGESFAVDASLVWADANRLRVVPGDEGLPPDAAERAVKRYLATLDDAAFGASTPVAPKRLSPTDPTTRYSATTPNQAFFSYSTNYLIDLRYAVIVDVEATTSVRPAEARAHRRTIERVQQTFGLWPVRLVADGAYGNAANLVGLVEGRGIEPHIAVFDTSARNDGTFARSDFTFNQKNDFYTCPGGHQLRTSNRNFTTPRSRVDKDGFIRYQAGVKDCSGCEFRQRCTPNTPARKIMRSVHEGALDMAPDIAQTDAYVPSRRRRKKVEMLFAHLKRILKLDRLRLRGSNGVRDEFLLAATAQKLLKMAKLMPASSLPQAR